MVTSRVPVWFGVLAASVVVAAGCVNKSPSPKTLDEQLVQLKGELRHWNPNVRKHARETCQDILDRIERKGGQSFNLQHIISLLQYKAVEEKVYDFNERLVGPDAKSEHNRAANRIWSLENYYRHHDSSYVTPWGTTTLTVDAGIPIREAAAETLGRVGDARAIGPLVIALDDDWRVAYQAANALGEMGSPAVEPVIQYVNHRRLYIKSIMKEDQLRYEETINFRGVISLLGQLKDRRAVDVLIECLRLESRVPFLRDPDGWVAIEYHNIRKEAAKALALIGDRRAIGPLREAPIDWIVRENALKVLRSQPSEDNRPPASQRRKHRSAVPSR